MDLVDIGFRLLAVVGLVFLNGFFVATEFSLVSVRRTRIDQLVAEGHGGASLVQRALHRLDAFVAATQLGITMASLGLGWIGEPALAHLIEPLFGFLPGGVAEATSHTIAVAVAFVIITSLHIVFGELAPKTIALQRPETIALLVSGPTELFLRVFWPFIAIMNGAGNMIARLLGVHPDPSHTTVHSVEELEMLVRTSRAAGVLDEDEQEMLINVFSFADRPAYQAMLPRTEVVTIDHDATVREFLDRFAETGHTRFPVLGPGGVDDVRGIVSAKDLLVAFRNEQLTTDDPITSLVREAFFTPATKRVGELLREMRDKHARMVILVDEYGGMAGVVTTEDLIEEIVGELDDELEHDEQDVRTIDDHTSVVEGQVRVEDINEELGLRIPEGDYETLAGFILTRLGRLPGQGDSVFHGGARFTVVEMQGPRIKRIEITRS